MGNNSPPYEVAYKGVLYRLRQAGGLGATGENDFTIVRKEYPSDTRELRYSGGAFILELTLKWGFAPGATADFSVTLPEEDAKLTFGAMVADGGVVSEEYKRLVEGGDAPGPVAKLTQKALPAPEQKQLTAAASIGKRVTALLRWPGGDPLLRTPPPQEVAKVVFHLCNPSEGFLLGGVDYGRVPSGLVEQFGQQLQIELMQRFPGATIDTRVVSQSDPHCGYPIVLNKNNVPLKTYGEGLDKVSYERELSHMALDIWREYYRKYQDQARGGE